MKRNNTITLLAILGGLMVIYLVISIMPDGGRSKSFREVLVELDTAKVTKVTITTPQSSATVEKNAGDNWKVDVANIEKPAVPGVVKNMLATLMSAKPSRIVARSEDKWKDFSVDSTGTRVEVYEGGDKTLDLVIGRFGMEGQRKFHTYVRLFDEQDVYVANDFMGISLPKTHDDFRNGDVLRIREDSLTQITFNYPDSAFSLLNAGGKWSSPDFPVDSANAAAYVRGLSFITSKNFAEGVGLSTPEINVTLSFDNRPEVQVSGFYVDKRWVIQSTANTDESFEDQSVFEKVFKGKDTFALR